MKEAVKTKRKLGGTVWGIVFFSAFTFFLSQGRAQGQTGYDPRAKTATEAIEQVVLANRILSIEGIFDYLGHVSVRNPENPKTFFISRSLAPELVTTTDILEVDLEGTVVTKTTQQPYSERVIHAGIYKARPDVNAVLHAHPLPLIVFSVVDTPIQPVSNAGSRYYGGVPVYDEYDFTSPGATGMLVTTKEEGDRVARCLGKGRAMLMRAHGFNAVGSSIADLILNSISLRDTAVMQLAALQLGKPKYLTEREVGRVGGSLLGLERAWTYWVAKVRRAYPDLK